MTVHADNTVTLYSSIKPLAKAAIGLRWLLRKDGLGVGHGLHHPDSERACGHAGEPVAVEVVEVHCCGPLLRCRLSMPRCGTGSVTLDP